MKKIITFIIFVFGVLINVSAQGVLGDGIRARSAELERIKRQTEKSAVIELGNGAVIDAAKFKKYFEGIQRLQDAIVEAYTKGEKINYKKINKLSERMTETALELKADLFADGEDGLTEENPSNAGGKSIKDLIVEQDNAVWRFVSSRFFQSRETKDPQAPEEALRNLKIIIDLSRSLRIKSDTGGQD